MRRSDPTHALALLMFGDQGGSDCLLASQPKWGGPVSLPAWYVPGETALSPADLRKNAKGYVNTRVLSEFASPVTHHHVLPLPGVLVSRNDLIIPALISRWLTPDATSPNAASRLLYVKLGLMMNYRWEEGIMHVLMESLKTDNLSQALTSRAAKVKAGSLSQEEISL